jgi:APA family basic amino acid/polyamine antiporter
MGYPVAPAIFVVACFLIVVNGIYSRPGPTGAGLLVMAAGIPLYMWLTRRRRPA